MECFLAQLQAHWPAQVQQTMCLVHFSQLHQYPVPTIDAPLVTCQSYTSLPILYDSTCKSCAHVLNYPSSMNQHFLLSSSDFDTAASGVSWFKSSSYWLVVFFCNEPNKQHFKQPHLILILVPPPEATALLTPCLLSAHATSLHMQLQYLPQQVPQSNITMISSLPWLHHRTLKYSLTNLHLLHCYILGITWPMCISSHPSSDLLYTDHIKYHPPNDSKLQYSPPLPQPYCTQSQMATLTQYSPPGPLQMNPAESPGISTQLNWCNCKLSTASTCTYMMLSSPTTTT